MPLFVARHEHPANACPAGDPTAAKFLLAHLSAPSARQHGIRIRGEAVLDGAHTLYLVAEAASGQRLEAFLEPFARAGKVEVWPASSCEAVVARARC